MGFDIATTSRPLRSAAPAHCMAAASGAKRRADWVQRTDFQQKASSGSRRKRHGLDVYKGLPA
jgi:hypothetical protein